MILCLRQGENPDLSPNLCTWAWRCLHSLKHCMHMSYDYEMLPRKNTESLFFPPKTWRKSRYLLQWKLVRSFSKILCTWVDFLLHEPREYSFLYILRILRLTLKGKVIAIPETHTSAALEYKGHCSKSVLLVTTYHTGIWIQAILTCLGYESVIQWEVTFSILKYQPSPVLWWKRKYTNTKHLQWSHICKALSVQNCFKS